MPDAESGSQPLLGRGASETVKNFSIWQFVFRRATHLTTGDVYEKAAALVDLAEDGEGIPLDVLNREDSSTAIHLYFVYVRLNFLWSLNLAALILISFFEVPLWCEGNFPDPCGSRDKFFLGDLPYLSRTQSLGFEVVILFLLAVHILFPIFFLGNKVFWRDTLNIFKVALFISLIADTILNMLYISPSGAISTLPFRAAPYIRVLIVTACIGDVRDSMKTLLGIIPDFADITALLIFFLLFSSWLAYVLFEDTNQGVEIFYSYPKTLYEMTVLFSTSNNPDVWLPAYKQSRFTSLFFIVYILLGVFFVTNLVLAVVYDSFKGQLAKSLLKVQADRDRLLKATFQMLDSDDKKYLDENECIHLFKALNNYRTLPQIAEDDMKTIFYALDDSGDIKINEDEFLDLCSAISLKFDKSEEPQVLEEFQAFYNSKTFTKVRKFVKSKTFEYIVLGMLSLNLITVIVETTLDLEDSTSQAVWQTVELSFGWLYLVELVLKVMVYGFHNYWRSGQNKFDFVITMVIVIFETAAFAMPNGLPYLENREWIRYLLIARLLRLVRVLMLLERFRLKLVTFVNLIPNLLPYLGATFFMMCIYCSIGVQAFGGLVYDGNPKLVGTPMEESDYYVHNFNDYPSGMVTLFNLIVLGNWQAWLETYAALTNVVWANLYFMSFYVVAILFVVNLVVAFVLEAYYAEIDIDEESKAARKEEESSESGAGTDSASDRYRQRAKRGKDNRVQNLLSHMLTAELEKGQQDSSG